MSKLQRDPDKEAFWRLAVSEQRCSLMSVRGFCRREGLSEASFYAWRRELQKRDAEVGEAAEGGRQAALPEKLAERRLEKPAGEEDRCGSDCGSFVEVCARPATPERTPGQTPGPSAAGTGGDATIELVLRRGSADAAVEVMVEIVVRVRAGFDAPLLRRVVEVLS